MEKKSSKIVSSSIENFFSNFQSRDRKESVEM